MAFHARQQQFKFRTWGGKRKGAGRKRHTHELPHVARPELDSRHPQHVTIRVRPDVISLRRSKSFAVVKRTFKRIRENLGMRVCHFSVQGNHIHLIVEAEDKTALGRALKGICIRIALALNQLTCRKGRVIDDRYDVHALKTPTEVGHALGYLRLNARHHGLTTSSLPDPYSSWVHQDLIAEPHSWLLRSGHQRAGPDALSERCGFAANCGRRGDERSRLLELRPHFA